MRIYVDLLGLMSDTIARMETIGFATSLSRLHQWCCYCYSSSQDKETLENVRRSRDGIQKIGKAIENYPGFNIVITTIKKCSEFN